jgi:hypothetical protein
MEIYKEIQGFEHNYMVSNYGNVKSLGKGKSTCPIYSVEKQITKRKKANGYLQVKLFKDGKRSHIGIHRLVAIAFLPNDKNKKEVNHKDCNKENNNVDNLEWVTSSENKLHYSKEVGYPLLNKKRVIQLTENNEIVNFYGSIRDAEIGSNTSRLCIRNVCNGKQKMSKGYKWQWDNLS